MAILDICDYLFENGMDFGFLLLLSTFDLTQLVENIYSLQICLFYFLNDELSFFQ